MQPDFWPFLQNEIDAPVGPPDALAHLEDWCNQLLSHEVPWQSHHEVPRQVGRDRVILHAFAGRRREGDYQWYIDRLCKESDGFLLHVVSLDIVIDKKFGDPSDPAIQAFWLRGIESGWVHGFLGGPPCATWSRARSVQAAADGYDRRGRLPRPVRSATSLWGFPALALRELAHVSDGNELLGFCLLALLSLAAQQMTGVLEHPAEPAEDDSPPFGNCHW